MTLTLRQIIVVRPMANGGFRSHLADVWISGMAGKVILVSHINEVSWPKKIIYDFCSGLRILQYRCSRDPN